jgi:DNA helicase-2/ATP-dependent DNA helicase PcrA
MNFNDSQFQAINYFTGPCLTLAGPGSGKTLVITQRAKNLIENQHVKPSDILIVTFTKAAAMEMKSRFARIMGRNNCPVTFGTFHAIFFSILKYAYHYTADNIIREEQKYILMRDIIRKFHLEYEDENEYIEQMLGEISLVKNTRMDIENYYSSNCAKDIFHRIYKMYQESLQRARLIDFDDMLVYTYELFTERPDILAIWQKRYPFILVDEFQDINQIQYEIVKMMVAPRNNLFVVGDDDQSIYRFRGATPKIMQSFVRDYPNAEQITLDINYRCASDIVEKAGKVIAHNTVRFPKKITANGNSEQCVYLEEYQNQRQQNLAVIGGIQQYIKNGGEYQNVAVLFRTNTQPRLLMEQLLEYNIPFKTKDRIPSLYDHWIAKDIFAYVRIAMGGRDRADFLRIMNRPKRYIGRDSLEEKTVAFDVWADYYAKND